MNGAYTSAREPGLEGERDRGATRAVAMQVTAMEEEEEEEEEMEVARRRRRRGEKKPSKQ